MSDEMKIKIRGLTKSEEDTLKSSGLTNDTVMKKMIAELSNPQGAESLRRYSSVTHRDMIQQNIKGFDAFDYYIKNSQAKPQSKPVHRKSVTRESEIHELIERVYRALRKEMNAEPSSKQVMRAIETRQDEFDSAGIVQEIKKGEIYWISSRGVEQRMKLSTLQNIVSKIRASKK